MEQKTLSQEYRDEEAFKEACELLMQWTAWQEAHEIENNLDKETES